MEGKEDGQKGNGKMWKDEEQQKRKWKRKVYIMSFSFRRGTWKIPEFCRCNGQLSLFPLYQTVTKQSNIEQMEGTSQRNGTEREGRREREPCPLKIEQEKCGKRKGSGAVGGKEHNKGGLEKLRHKGRGEIKT